MDNLARLFIAKLRAHGHRPYVHNGGFGIEPRTRRSLLRHSEPALSSKNPRSTVRGA
jgi:hypothetical protein